MAGVYKYDSVNDFQQKKCTFTKRRKNDIQKKTILWEILLTETETQLFTSPTHIKLSALLLVLPSNASLQIFETHQRNEIE